MIFIIVMMQALSILHAASTFPNSESVLASLNQEEKTKEALLSITRRLSLTEENKQDLSVDKSFLKTLEKRKNLLQKDSRCIPIFLNKHLPENMMLLEYIAPFTKQPTGEVSIFAEVICEHIAETLGEAVNIIQDHLSNNELALTDFCKSFISYQDHLSNNELALTDFYKSFISYMKGFLLNHSPLDPSAQFIQNILERFLQKKYFKTYENFEFIHFHALSLFEKFDISFFDFYVRFMQSLAWEFKETSEKCTPEEKQKASEILTYYGALTSH